MKHHLDIYIEGKVRKADFNYYSQRAANRFGINAVYKNGDSRHVDLEIEGDTEAINNFVEYIKNGPLEKFIESFRTEKGEFVNIQGFTSLRVHKDKESLIEKIFGKKKKIY
jgi:acylphosphatase